MENVINLLKEKNHFLKKFHTLNKAELLRLSEGDFSRLDYFYQSRENILDMITHIENRMEETLGVSAPVDPVGDEERRRVRRELDFKDDVVNQILDQDLQILSFIETAKTDIIRELQDTTKKRDVIGSYRSEPQPNKRLRTIK
ncbi:MAG: hypothetical protein ABL958_03930 [Bdellovibrionia bacterium]